MTAFLVPTDNLRYVHLMRGKLAHLRTLLLIDDGWTDDDLFIGLACDASDHLLDRLLAMPINLSEYQEFWWQAAAPVQLARQLFDRPDSAFGKALAATADAFHELADLVEELPAN